MSELATRILRAARLGCPKVHDGCRCAAEAVREAYNRGVIDAGKALTNQGDHDLCQHGCCDPADCKELNGLCN